MTGIPDKKDYKTPKEAAYLLNLSVKTIYRYIDEGTLSAVRIGKKVLWISNESLKSQMQLIE